VRRRRPANLGRAVVGGLAGPAAAVVDQFSLVVMEMREASQLSSADTVALTPDDDASVTGVLLLDRF